MGKEDFYQSLDHSRSFLKHYAIRLTKDVDDANDLLQETMLKALANREKFQWGTNLKGWLSTIMKNTFITNYHKMSRRKPFYDTEDYYHPEALSVPAKNSAISGFVLKDIGSAMQKINEACRTPLLMYIRGLKYREISLKLNLPIGTIKNRIHMARKELQSYLSDYRYVA